MEKYTNEHGAILSVENGNLVLKYEREMFVDITEVIGPDQVIRVIKEIIEKANKWDEIERLISRIKY